MEVKINNLVKIFSGKKGAKTVAVNNMNFDIPDGKLCGLLGPSGCGKSTTLYMIAGLHNVTEGKIYFGDEDVTNLPAENRGIGLVFQNYALYPHFNVRQNIMFPLDNVRPKLTYDEKCAIVLENAKIVHIEKLLDRKPKELSGGQQQRVAIARALAKRPRVLLLDEPLSNLDARLRLQTREEIKRIQKETGITTVFVTHDQEEAMSISDFIVVMRDGIVQQKDEPQKVYDEPANLFVAKFLGTPAINVFKGEIKDGVLFIAGNKLSDNKELRHVHIEELTCPHCGAIVPHNAKYCNVCGANIREGSNLVKNKKNEKTELQIHNLQKTIAYSKTGDKSIDKLLARFKKTFTKFDSQVVIDKFNELYPTVVDEKTLAHAQGEVIKARALEQVEGIKANNDSVAKVISDTVEEIRNSTNAFTKEGANKINSLVRKIKNANVVYNIAQKVDALYKESDWEATRNIKKTQEDIMYQINDIESPESQEMIEKIIKGLEKRLNPERTCQIGIRPESFRLVENGPIKVKIENIEHIGRDISVIGEVVGLEEGSVKIIISNELLKDCQGKEFLYFEPKRIYVFEDTGERIL